MTVVVRLLMLLLVATLTFAGGHECIAATTKTSKQGKLTTSAKKKGTVAKKKSKSTKKSAKSKAAAKTSKKSASPQQEPMTPTAPAMVKELRYWSNPDYTRVAVTLDRDAYYQPNVLKSSSDATRTERIYIDIKGAHIAPGVKDATIGDGLLKTARVGQYQPDVVRLVLDVENIRDYKIFPLSDPSRIIIDVKGERPTEITSTPPPVIRNPPTAAELYRSPAERKPDMQPAKLSSVRRIVIDPGHGGKDPGAIGPSGTQEKDVVLSLGLKVAERIRQELGVEVIMTRSTDVFIPLEERTAIANKLNADLFISVHANAALNRAASGLETYYLNLAKTEKAAQLAARENGTSLEKVSVLQAILFDLMANYKLNDSAHLADEVQKSVYKRLNSSYAGIKNLGVKQGPFYVLVGASMPSILVETAFISNPVEEEHLNDSEFLATAAEGILDGVKSYMAGVKQ